MRALAGHVDKSVGLATHYHTNWVYPYWSPELRKLAQVGTHLFFGWPGSWGGPPAFRRGYRGGEPVVDMVAMTIDSPAPSPAMPGMAFSSRQAPTAPTSQGGSLVSAEQMPDLGHVPLYGNRVRLARQDGRAFALVIGPDATAARLVNAALALCADSDDRAHVFRSDAAQRSDLIARRWST